VREKAQDNWEKSDHHHRILIYEEVKKSRGGGESRETGKQDNCTKEGEGGREAGREGGKGCSPGTAGTRK